MMAEPPKRRGPLVIEEGAPPPDGPGPGTAARRGPVVIEDLPQADETPATAPPVPETGPPAGPASVRAMAAPARRGWLGRLALGAAGSLLGLAIGVAAWDFAAGLLERNLWLGRAALLLGAVAVAGLLAFVVRELAGLARLARLDRLRMAAEAALRDRDRPAALGVAAGLAALYAGRPDLAWAQARVAERTADTLDADALIDLAEREYLAALDARATAEVEGAARRVAAVTALVPLAFADVAAALVSNVAMIRRIAEIYGGRAGTLGSWRLFRAVSGHLIATGAVAVGDDLIGSVLGGSALTRLSRRFGEGVINGALTARVGIAAMEVCRPLPFRALEKPGVAGLLRRALTGFLPG